MKAEEISPGTKIRSRAPLRLGLAGGGTDVSPYLDDYGGAVLNATIDRFAFAFIERSRDENVHFIASDLEVEETLPLDLATIGQARLSLHAAVYRRMFSEFRSQRLLPVTVRTLVDAPPGSGLGSSSALVVALVDAFRAALDLPLGPYEIAHLAYEIERVDLGQAGGKQDQYAAAFGGLNFIEFSADDRVIVNPLRLSAAVSNELQSSIITCFSGISRNSSLIIDQQRTGMAAGSARTIDGLHRLKADAIDMKRAVLHGNISEIAEILAKSWTAKKQTAAGISTGEIDRLMDVALNAGALAGKVSGAGGGGFVMFIARPEERLRVIRALNSAGGNAQGVQFTSTGVESWISPGRNL